MSTEEIKFICDAVVACVAMLSMVGFVGYCVHTMSKG